MSDRFRRHLAWLCAGVLAACTSGGEPLRSSEREQEPASSGDAPASDAGAATRSADARAQAKADAASTQPTDERPAMPTPPSGGALENDDCGGANYAAKGKELEILVLFDNSGSMLLPALSWECLTRGVGCPATTAGVLPSLWQVAVSELTTFANDTRSSGVSLGLTYFATECGAEAYAAPQVPLGLLPMQAPVITQSLAQTQLAVGTPTRPALEGALAFMQKRAAMPGYNARSVLLVVTDGVPDPVSCEDNTIESVARVAARGQMGDFKIPTYVFVTAPDLALDDIARAGGTEKALVADLSKAGALSNAMSSVRDQEIAALPCEYELPPEYFSEVNDPTLVNLRRDGQPFRKVPSGADCDEDGGWYYDDPGAPTRILTCASTCANLKRGGTVDILLNCPIFVQ